MVERILIRRGKKYIDLEGKIALMLRGKDTDSEGEMILIWKGERILIWRRN